MRLLRILYEIWVFCFGGKIKEQRRREREKAEQEEFERRCDAVRQKMLKRSEWDIKSVRNAFSYAAAEKLKHDILNTPIRSWKELEMYEDQVTRKSGSSASGSHGSGLFDGSGFTGNPFI